MTDTKPAVDLEMAEQQVDLPEIGDTSRYDALMETISNRVTVRKFQKDYIVPDEHYQQILATAPGFVVVCSDMRWVNAFPVLNDGSDLDRMYKENAERILLQSVAASTMSAHLAAAALGYNVWWVTAIGQEEAQAAMRPLLDIPDEISVLDILLFGPADAKPYKRFRRPMQEIAHFDRYDRSQFISDEDLQDWIKTRRHKVMYKDATRVD